MNKRKENMKRFGIAMAFYSVSVFVTMFVMLQMTSPLRYLIALIPTVPSLAALYFYVNALRASDELARLQTYEGVTFGFAISVIAFVTWSFLEGAGAPLMRAPFALFIAMGSFAVGMGVSAWRYR